MTDEHEGLPAHRTPPEVDRVAAAKAAVAARRARAAVKAAIASGERSALDVARAAWDDSLVETTSAERSLRVRDLLVSLPGIGPARAEAIMGTLRIAPSKRLGGLGTRQRTALADWLAARGRKRGASKLVVLAGPTAVGKGTVSAHIRQHYPDVNLSVSATTRKPRPGEVDGVHYYFVDDDEFDRMIRDRELLEWATVHNSYRYGTPRPPIDRALDAGEKVMLEIDLQGARQVRDAMPEAVLVFLLPPTWEELVRRLIGRGTESAEEQARRLETAKVELAAQDEFDVRIVNSDVGTAAREVVDLFSAP
ncbi:MULTISPECIES: guanylate kinase [Curtobacterium]|uniref:guanylate kinase n=1 Tax=Curtobacterium TaxID=2034 RepID=UPI000AE914A5|nr:MULTISPECIES: guanylate kinase [Curtobacterium]MCS0644588.1 guanylate kinase [Curtobacterium flaccumfaciens pv. flaccumfaciens]MCS6527720.1 guanylate kinase [Curtobacterium flaccumfaciens pv. flaccumfaciens]MCS6528052.1 guanylate kinase [Curtobacterium flaccumfaciens pv. flaccumfaciens]MCS6546564.1 guanylate kinase [Curtobacterium flaccumfaciens pv. flaccumfaciens]MCS6551746.1 guanylate kinase [Curtobacterium flaccumfaciens pv. flaccumfaciens]